MTDKILIDRETVVQSLETLQRSPWKNWRVDRSIDSLTVALANAELVEPKPKLWLWKNFVDGKQEYWVFDNLYPININDDDPQTLGDPCGYALFKPSRNGRKDTQ